jgi:hypothetical protein
VAGLAVVLLVAGQDIVCYRIRRTADFGVISGEMAPLAPFSITAVRYGHTGTMRSLPLLGLVALLACSSTVTAVAPTPNESSAPPGDQEADAGGDTAAQKKLGEPRRLAEGKTTHLAVDESAVYFVQWVQRDDIQANIVQQVPKAGGTATLLLDYRPSVAWVGLAASDHRVYVYDGDCCQVPNVHAWDTTAHTWQSTGNTAGKDTFHWTELDLRGPSPVLFAQGEDDYAFFTDLYNAEGHQMVVDFGTGITADAVTSNKTRFFFATSDAQGSKQAIQGFDRAKVELSPSRSMKKASVISSAHSYSTANGEGPVLVADETSLYVFASDGIERVDLATNKATKVSSEAVSAAAAMIVDGEILVARRGQQGGALSRFDTETNSFTDIATLPSRPTRFAFDAQGFYWTSDDGVWAISR